MITFLIFNETRPAWPGFRKNLIQIQITALPRKKI
jgi:hypothetical protein